MGTLALGAATALLAAPPAHADTYQLNVQIINHHTNQCLDSNYGGSVYLGTCNGGNYQRWNVTSWWPDTNNYYSNVQLQDVQTKRCLSVYENFDGYHFPATTTVSCDDMDNKQQWDMTWVGNTSPNPQNSFQFMNNYDVAGTYETCLDAGQTFDQKWLYNYGQAQFNTCPWHTDDWQIWSMQH
ncbi:hypothetical protein [Kitasatospora nipponensis]